MTRWWCSVVVSTDAWDATQPAEPPVLGVWSTGWTADGRETVCLWLEAVDPAECRAIVERLWPEVVGQPWRIEPQPREGIPGDRFPVGNLAGGGE